VTARTVTKGSGALWVAGSALAAMVVLYVAAVWTLPGQLLDQQLMVAAATVLATSDWTSTLLWMVSPLSVGWLALVVALGAAIGQGARSAVAAATTMGGTLATAELFKAILYRPPWIDTAANSLPSGHVAAVAALTAGAVVAAPRALREVVAVTGATAVVLTGVATMAEEWHRPSDVVAAVLVAVAVAGLTWRWHDRLSPPNGLAGRSQGRG
jgi:membrane-associated phospholipid phosphatase